MPLKLQPRRKICAAGIDLRLRILRASPLDFPPTTMTTLTKVTLYTDPADGCAKFKESAVALTEGSPASQLSALMPSGGLQLRMSPVGFRSHFHCSVHPQWVFILSGVMEIGLQDGSSRTFAAGEHFYSEDLLPAGTMFDAKVHGHWSRQVGLSPLVTAFVRA
jgi:hypothetical protein